MSLKILVGRLVAKGCQRLDRLPSSDELCLIGLTEIGKSDWCEVGGFICRLACCVRESQSAGIESGQDFGLRQCLLDVELHVEDGELIGTELADDSEGATVPEPLGPHTESNGSHEIEPPAWRRVESEIG